MNEKRWRRRVVELRRESGLTQSDVGAAIDCNWRTIARYEASPKDVDSRRWNLYQTAVLELAQRSAQAQLANVERVARKLAQIRAEETAL